MKHLTLALPTYNEAANIENVLVESVQALERLDQPWEILVIDNDSSDGTHEVAERFAAGDERIRIICHETNRQYSGSCETAIRESKGDVVAIMDSDGQVTAYDLPRFLEKMDDGANLVIGWRKERHDPVFRKLMSWVFNVLGWWYTRYPYRDLNCGYRVFDSAFVDAVQIEHHVNLANPELYVRAKLAGLRVDEVVVRHRARAGGASSHDFSRLFRVFLEVRRYLASLRRDLRMSRRP